MRLRGLPATFLGFPKFEAKLAKSEGAIAANHAWFETLGIDLNDSGVAPDLLEEVLLTRNRVQHPESIGFSWLKQSDSDYKNFLQPFFANEAEIQMSTDDDGSPKASPEQFSRHFA